MGDWTGTVPTYAAGDEVPASKMQTETAIETAITAAWTSWTPTLTNLTLGNGTLTSVYRRLQKTLDFDFYFVLGSTSAVGTNPLFTLPATPAARYTTTDFTAQLAYGFLLDSSGGVSRPAIGFWHTSGIEIYFYNATPTHTGITATVPWTWATSDVLHVHGTLELA